jgi:rubrerythrin
MSMDTRLTSLEVIGMAIRSEEDASKFYGRISKLVGNPAVRKKYETLAREEVGHKQTLIDLYRTLAEGMADPPPIPGSPETAEGGDDAPSADATLEDLLKLAIQRERDAYDYYRAAARQSIEPSGVRVLEELAEIEHGHEVMLEKELAAYRRDREWYVSGNDDDLVHEGP